MLRITEILTDDKKPTIGPRPKREKVVATPAEGDDEAPKAAKKKAPAKKAVRPRRRPSRARQEGSGEEARGQGQSDKK